MEEILRQKCKEAGISPDILTEQEKDELCREIEMEKRGLTIADGVLSNPELIYRSR